jgi:soluble lytic murein transglycosylase
MGVIHRTLRRLSIAALTLAWALSTHASDPDTRQGGSTPPSVAGSSASYADARNAFRQAYARALTGETDSNGDSASLRAYPLYPYLQAARLRQALSGRPQLLPGADERAAAFVAAHADEPVARGLRRAWLDSLADRKRWDVFLRVYRDGDATVAQRCQSFVARIELGRGASLARDIQKQWLTGRSLPECERAFAWLEERGLLTAELIGQRAHLALVSGNAPLARELAARLPAALAAPVLQWVSLLETPRESINAAIASSSVAVDSTALLAGWTRFARKDPQAAETTYESLVRSRGLDRASASPYALALALALAWDRDPGALEYFERVAPADLDDDALEWRVRAALWAKDWSRAAQSIAALSEADRRTARWRYWEARIAEQLHDSERARTLYESALADDSYYSALAAARLHRPIVPHPQALPLDREILEGLSRMPALVRARELFLCDMRAEAALEWRLALESLSASERVQAIRLAAEWGWYDQAVAAATAEHVFNAYDLLYPRPFDAEVRVAAEQAAIAPEIIYGVVRQESLYRTDAVSSAGALGLMQLQPATARSTARYWKRRRPAVSELFDPRINLSLGAARLRMLLDRLEGQLPVALAAYNAGINAASRWLPSQPMDADIWIENIPYNETRGYVERVLWQSVLFSWLRSAEPQRVDDWLAPIEPTRQVAGGGAG